MSKRDISLFLKDILTAINKTQRFVLGKTFEDFQGDDLLIDGVTRNLEVIGEAAKQIPEEFRSRYKEINWTRVVGFRNIAIHEYFEVDIEIVWTIATKQLEPLRKSIEKMLKEFR
ncbi:MAG: DUF86 domain-containing protein [Elusimicrobiota bacterium]